MSAADLLAPSPKLKPVTSAAIRQSMLKTWAAPEYAVMWEVADATGFRHSRFADAVIMSLWPSRGLELHGVEIKVSRSDWKREAADPKKAEKIGAYCDRWWVHTGPNVIHDQAEVPQAWGWREFDGSKWRTRREAEKTDAVACDRSFLAALLRRADVDSRKWIETRAEEMVAEEREKIADQVKREVERRTERSTVAAQQIEAFEAASGLKLCDYYAGSEAAEIGALVKAIREAGILQSWNSLAHVLKTLRDHADNLEKALRETGLPGAVDLPARAAGPSAPKKRNGLL